MRRGFDFGLLLVLVAVLVLAASTVGAEKILVEPAAIAAVAPDGMVGLELGFRVLPLGSDDQPANERRWLWVDLAGMTREFEDWSGVLGLSTEIRKGKPTRGGLVWDFRDEALRLIFTKEFSTAF